MIYKRVAARLRAQDWLAIMIELAIVVVGVFIGTWVANWNQDRAEQRDINAIVEKLAGDVSRRMAIVQNNHDYYGTTGKFARIAFAGWARDPAISDRDFVIAAYQASQVLAFNSDSQTYNMLLGGDQARKISDVPLRDAIIGLLTFNYEPVSLPAVRTRYRDDVRAVIPDEIQTAIRAQCSDFIAPTGMTVLPSTCDIAVSEPAARSGAAALRAHPELVGALRQHRAQTAIYLYNIDQLKVRLRRVQAVLDQPGR